MIFKNKYELGFVEVTETHLGTVRLRAKAANGHEMINVFERDEARRLARHILTIVGEGDDK